MTTFDFKGTVGQRLMIKQDNHYVDGICAHAYNDPDDNIHCFRVVTADLKLETLNMCDLHLPIPKQDCAGQIIVLLADVEKMELWKWYPDGAYQQITPKDIRTFLFTENNKARTWRYSFSFKHGEHTMFGLQIGECIRIIVNAKYVMVFNYEKLGITTSPNDNQPLSSDVNYRCMSYGDAPVCKIIAQVSNKPYYLVKLLERNEITVVSRTMLQSYYERYNLNMLPIADYDLILANVPPHVRNKICNLPIL